MVCLGGRGTRTIDSGSDVLFHGRSYNNTGEPLRAMTRRETSFWTGSGFPTPRTISDAVGGIFFSIHVIRVINMIRISVSRKSNWLHLLRERGLHDENRNFCEGHTS